MGDKSPKAKAKAKKQEERAKEQRKGVPVARPQHPQHQQPPPAQESQVTKSA